MRRVKVTGKGTCVGHIDVEPGEGLQGEGVLVQVGQVVDNGDGQGGGNCDQGQGCVAADERQTYEQAECQMCHSDVSKCVCPEQDQAASSQNEESWGIQCYKGHA